MSVDKSEQLNVVDFAEMILGLKLKAHQKFILRILPPFLSAKYIFYRM